jgi:hypothetical protein
VWPPSVVATNHLSPAEPWRLTHGNALRVFGLFVLTIFVVYAFILVFVLGGVFAFRDQLGHLAPPHVPDLPNSVDRQQAIREMIATQLAAYWPVLWLVGLLVYTAAISMTVALISYSYKALKGYDAGEPIPAAA